jgi:L-ribulose-5-phosphate 3-epimerase
MTRIGIMQGRLLPPVDDTIFHFPRNQWAEEFTLASQAQLDCIEWIYDVYGADVNPIATEAGKEEINLLAGQNNIRILSLCANYFMDNPLVRVTTSELEDRIRTLDWLFLQSQKIGIQQIVLPFLDSSRIETEKEFRDVIAVLQRVTPAAENARINLLLESSLEPHRLAALLAELPSPNIKINYDTGNSASLGYDLRDEFAAYGQRIGSIHVKDRLRGGGTVLLGTGNADFDTLAACLEEIGYTGDFVLEAARGRRGNELALAEQNREFIKNRLCVV